MEGDSIVVEEQHIKAAKGAVALLFPEIDKRAGRYSITVAGESGSGKSEIATAISEELSKKGITSVIFQQDDYFVYPPKTNDATRRKDIEWVGPKEVRLDLMDQHLRDFMKGKRFVQKPLVIYSEDRIDAETLDFENAQVAICEGTYTTLLKNANTHIFIDRNYEETRKHREKRIRDTKELDPFIDKVLKLEHGIISKHKSCADIIVGKDYESFKT